MLHGHHLSVLEAQDRDEFDTATRHFSNGLGFDVFSTTTVVDRLSGDSEFISTGDIPAGYLALHVNRDMGRRDPVTQHCKSSSLPIVWDRSTYIHAGQVDKWESQAAYGICCGIALALHLPNGLHFMIGMERDRPLSIDASQLDRMGADLLLFAVHAQETARRIFLPPSPADDAFSPLSPRELECLRWTMEGKTAWELGRILGIAENTVNRHLHSATQKLSATSKHQAVLKALRLKLIW